MNNYKKEIVSPFQVKNRPYNIQNNRAVQDEIRKNIKSISLTAEFSEDTETLQAFKHINGVVAFLCVLKKDGLPIGFGRGMSVISSQNRFLEKAVSFSANAALIDSVVRAVKILGVTEIDFSQNVSVPVSDEMYGIKKIENFVPITDKQKSFLLKLIKSDSVDESDREQIESSIDDMSKSEAGQKINYLLSTSESKINY